jgi:D-alanyl-D-alanine carboxypeptidase
VGVQAHTGRRSARSAIDRRLSFLTLRAVATDTAHQRLCNGGGTGVVNGNGRRNRTRQRLAGPGLALLMIAGGVVPAQAAEAAEAGATAASAGTTWSQLVRRRLNLETQAARLTAQLPGLGAAVTTRHAEISRARRAEKAAAASVTSANTADEKAGAKLAAAKVAAKTAKQAVQEARKRKPYRSGRVAKAKKALATANATVQARTATARRAAAAVKAARSGHAAATRQVTAATAAHQAAIKAVGDARATIEAWPVRRSALTAQVTAISGQVVTQTRASFTTAQTTKVYGVTVNKIVAYPFQRMINDAGKAGVQLSGGGFRTKQRQIELRKVNGCPDVWTAPASSCRVPTAIPGRSLHEIGLAVDLTSGGRTINTRKSKAFKWLAANAGRYGFVNLPSEPWHWSVTGG